MLELMVKARVHKFRAPSRPVTKFCMVASNIRGSSVPKLLHIIPSAPKILKWLQYLWQIYVPLCNGNSRPICFPIASKPIRPVQPSSHWVLGLTPLDLLTVASSVCIKNTWSSVLASIISLFVQTFLLRFFLSVLFFRLLRTYDVGGCWMNGWLIEWMNEWMCDFGRIMTGTDKCTDISLICWLISLIFVNVPSILVQQCEWAELCYIATTGSVYFNWWFANLIGNVIFGGRGEGGGVFLASCYCTAVMLFANLRDFVVEWMVDWSNEWMCDFGRIMTGIA